MVKRIVLGLVAAVLILAAGVLGALAGWAHLTFADGGVIAFDAGTLTPGPTDTAVIVDVDRFGASIPYLDSVGTTALSAHPAGAGDPTATVFLGAASTADVDAYIKATSYAVAIRGQGGWELREIPGSAVPAPPGDQGFWIAEAVGRTASIGVPATRPLTLVMMNPSAVPVGPVSLTIDVAVPGVSSWVLGLGIAAVVLLIVGVVLLVLALRSPRAPGRHEATGADAVAAVVVTPTDDLPEAEEPEVDAAPTDDLPEAEEPDAGRRADRRPAGGRRARPRDPDARPSWLPVAEPVAPARSRCEPVPIETTVEPVQTELEVLPDTDVPEVETKADEDAPPVG